MIPPSFNNFHPKSCTPRTPTQLPYHRDNTTMATLKQIEANRLNAQKSTGPRSAEGKAASSMNALKSGIDAESHLIRGEDPDALETLTAEYYQRFRPVTPEQRHYVDTLIRDDWQLRRLAKADAQIWEYKMETAFKLDENSPLGQSFHNASGVFIRLQRRIDAAERSYKSALHELERLQSTPPPAPQPIEIAPASPTIGFVPQPQPQSPAPAGNWPLATSALTRRPTYAIFPTYAGFPA